MEFLEWAAPRALETAAAAWAILSAPWMLRAYVIALSVAMLGVSLGVSYMLKQWLDGITEDFFVVRYPGRVPVNPRSIRRRALRAAKTKNERMIELWSKIVALFALGIMVPAVFLYLGTVHYGWFDPTTLPLAVRGTGEPSAVPPPFELMLYVADQLLRGGLFDAFEVFQWPVAGHTNNHKAVYYSLGVLGFHLYAEAFVIFGLLYLMRAGWVMRGFIDPKPRTARAA